MLFVIVAGFIQAVQIFDQAYVIASNGAILGSPAGATATLVIFLYQQAFRLNNLGYGSAAAVVLLFIVFAGHRTDPQVAPGAFMKAPGWQITAKVLKYSVLAIGAMIALGPILFALYTSFELPADYPRIVPFTRLTLSNYRYVFDNAPVLRWYVNTAFVTLGVVVGAVVVNTMAGYALARIRYPGRALSFSIVLAILMVPLQAILIPLYLLVAQLGWLNSYQALIIPFIANPFLIFLMRQSFHERTD